MLKEQRGVLTAGRIKLDSGTFDEGVMWMLGLNLKCWWHWGLRYRFKRHVWQKGVGAATIQPSCFHEVCADLDNEHLKDEPNDLKARGSLQRP